MSNLYEIAVAFRADADKLADLDLDDQTLQDTLEAMSGELEVKCQQTAFVVRNLEATAAAIKEAEAKMCERRKALEARAARVKDWLLSNMVVAGVRTIDCPHFRLAVRENPPAVEVYEPGLIPQEFFRQPEPPPPAIDKTAIKEALKAGQDVPGCRLTRGQRLEVK
jgi:hypothetical protein